MEVATQQISGLKLTNEPMTLEQVQSDEQKLKIISLMVKEWKNGNNEEIYCKVSWMQILKHGKYLLQYLSRDKIQDRNLFFETLASLDSLLSIFKLNLFLELNFTKSFYRNIQRQFDQLCLEYNFTSNEKHQKQHEFQLHSILFLLVMLIYFSGKPQSVQFRTLPLQIVNKTFMNSLISLQINITQKNERIIGLILAYLVKNVNLKIYGQKMLKFILNHFDKIHMPRTVYHFIYCMREVHLEREIDIKILRKYSLMHKLWKFWTETIDQRQSIYLVDYINHLLRKYPQLLNNLGPMEPLLQKLRDFTTINQFSIVHQALILQIVTKVYQLIGQDMRQKLIESAFSTCETIDFSLKLISCIMSRQRFITIFEYVFPFAESLKSICRNRELKSVIFGLEILYEMVRKCEENHGWGMMQALREKVELTLDELKEYHICQREIALIEECFLKMISINRLTLC